MSLVLTCSCCNQKLKADDKLYGKTVKCPKCATPLSIPAQHVNNDIGDLLDDELAMAPAEEVSTSARAPALKCERCGDELTPGSRYCLACGHNNLDMDATVGQLALDYDKRQQKIEAELRPRHWLWRALIFWS